MLRLLAAAALTAALSACAAPTPPATGAAAPGAEFVSAANQVMVFAPTAQVLGEGRGYTALVYRGLRSPAEAVFEQLPYPQPPVETVQTSAPGVLVPVDATAPASNLGAPGDVLLVLDARQGAELGVEDVAVEVIEATPTQVRFQVVRLVP